MKAAGILLAVFLNFACMVQAADLSSASSQDLLIVYKQLRSIQNGGGAATTDKIVLKRDAATFTFNSGTIAFAAPIADHVLAAYFQGEGKFELAPPSPIHQKQISRFTKGPRLLDTFHEAVFFFTDNTYEELAKLAKIQPGIEPAAGAAFSAAQKRYSERYNAWIENGQKGYPPMRNLAARMLADLSDRSSKGFFLADFKGKDSGDLLFHISWNRDTMLLPEYSKGEEIMLLHLNSSYPYEWWSGFHLSPEYAQQRPTDHSLNQVHCINEQIDLGLDNNQLAATAQMEFEVSEISARVLPFNLNSVLRISSIEDSAGNKLSFIQEDRKLDSDPWLILSEPTKPHGKHTIKITYREDSTRDSRVIHQRGAGLYYVTARASWFPSFGAHNDRANFQLRAHSPKKYKFVASGALVSTEKTKDELLTTWKSEIPLSLIGFNYGDYVEASQNESKLNITAYSGKEIPDELKDMDSQISRLRDIGTMGDAEGDLGVLRGGFNTAANVKYAARLSFQALKFFDFYFGPLPFKTISVTEQPVRGYGQSWPNLIFLPYDSLLDALTRNKLGLQDSGEEREFYRTVAVHEMAHQWWGHLVEPRTYHDEWLSEGFAEFASSLYLRQFDPKSVDDFWSMKRTWLLSKNRSGHRPVEAGPLWLNNQLNANDASGDAKLIYYKGAYVLEMLREFMHNTKFQNPDGKFIEMLHDFATTYAGKSASTEDFRQIVEKHIGMPMEWFFDEWVYGKDIPTYDFSYQLSDIGSGKTELLMTITQSGVPESFQMQLPLYAIIKGELQFMGLVPIKGNQPLKTNLNMSVRPDKILLDPRHSILAEIHQ